MAGVGAAGQSDAVRRNAAVVVIGLLLFLVVAYYFLSQTAQYMGVPNCGDKTVDAPTCPVP